jgi:AcrR family transcriptional regulator
MADDTRSRIQAVALELFTEQGYDATSLREIAERLGVTKAALYYHFKSKEEIVDSLTADHVARVDSLMEWALAQEKTPEFRREFLRRYMVSLNSGQHFKVMKFFQQNQTAVKKMGNAAKWRETLEKMSGILLRPNATPAERLRAGLAVFALHASWMLLPEGDYTEQERVESALAVASELISEPQ